MTVHLEEVTVVYDASDNGVHVISLVDVLRNEGVERLVNSADRIVGRNDRGYLHVVLREEGEELLDGSDGFGLIVGCEMCNAALGSVNIRTTEVLLADDLSGHALHNGWSGEEHVGGILHHEGEIGEGR